MTKVQTLTDSEILSEITDNIDYIDGDIDENQLLKDEEVLSVEELNDRIIGAINLLDHIDEYKIAVSNKRREVSYREFDLMHNLEVIMAKMENDPEFKISAKGLRNFFNELGAVRELRRILKVSDELIYEFQKQTNRLNNTGNRALVRSDIGRTKNKLTQPHRNRIYNEEELNKLFDIKENDSNEENKDDTNE